MPRSAEQLEQIRKQKKAHIRQTALALFAEHGFHATSISQISKRARISKGLIYNYFESKDAILEDIFNWAFATIYSNFDTNKDGILSKEEFIQFIRSSLQTTMTNKSFWKLYSALVLQPHILETYTAKYEDKGKDIMRMIRGFIASQGSVSPDKDLFAISCLLKGANLILITAPDFFPVENLEKDTIEACFKLISKNE
jgi:AcrR family transcriptional regulator